jgi:hypothetical protein
LPRKTIAAIAIIVISKIIAALIIKISMFVLSWGLIKKVPKSYSFGTSYFYVRERERERERVSW